MLAEYRSVDKRLIRIDDRELSARLGRVCEHTEPELYRVYETVLRAAEPRFAFSRVKVTYGGSGAIDLGFCKTESLALTRCLDGAEEAIVLLCTLGSEVDRLISKLSRTSRAEAFIFDAVASALIEAAVDVAQEEICRGLNTTARFSPGYADLTLECQGPLLDSLGAPTYLGVALTASGLMSPLKTVSAIIGIKG